MLGAKSGKGLRGQEPCFSRFQQPWLLFFFCFLFFFFCFVLNLLCVFEFHTQNLVLRKGRILFFVCLFFAF